MTEIAIAPSGPIGYESGMVRSFTEDGVRQIARRAEAVAPLKARIAELEAENRPAEEKLHHLLKPPSSDIVKPPRPAQVVTSSGSDAAAGNRIIPATLALSFRPNGS